MFLCRFIGIFIVEKERETLPRSVSRKRTFEGGAVKAESLDYLGVKIDSEGRFSPAELVRKLRWEDFTVDNLLEEGYIESEDELVRGITLGDYYYSVWQKRDNE